MTQVFRAEVIVVVPGIASIEIEQVDELLRAAPGLDVYIDEIIEIYDSNLPKVSK